MRTCRHLGCVRLQHPVHPLTAHTRRSNGFKAGDPYARGHPGNAVWCACYWVAVNCANLARTAPFTIWHTLRTIRWKGRPRPEPSPIPPPHTHPQLTPDDSARNDLDPIKPRATGCTDGKVTAGRRPKLRARPGLPAYLEAIFHCLARAPTCLPLALCSAAGALYARLCDCPCPKCVLSTPFHHIVDIISSLRNHDTTTQSALFLPGD